MKFFSTSGSSDTEPDPNVLDQPATIAHLRLLLEHEILSPDQHHLLEGELRRRLPWRLWLERSLLALAVGILVSALGCLLGQHWDNLPPIAKVSLAAVAILTSLVIGQGVGWRTYSGKMALTAASKLVGLFWMVYGIVYDSQNPIYTLFLTWSVMILPWVLIGRFIPLWLIWWTLVNTTAATYLSTLEPANGEFTFRWTCLLLATMNLFAYFFREKIGQYREKAGWNWLDNGWSSVLLIFAAAAAGSAWVCSELFHAFPVYPKAPHLLVSNGIALGLVLTYCLAFALPVLHQRYVSRSLISLTVISLFDTINLSVWACLAWAQWQASTQAITFAIGCTELLIVTIEFWALMRFKNGIYQLEKRASGVTPFPISSAQPKENPAS